MTLMLDSAEALRQRLQQPAVYSDWMMVDQALVTDFGELTGDRAWIHLDPQRAARESPFGRTIAHGLLTLSVLPALWNQCFEFGNVDSGLNCGFDRVRFTAPVPSGSRVRGRFMLQALAERNEGTRTAWDAQVEVEGSERPALIATWLIHVAFHR